MVKHRVPGQELHGKGMYFVTVTGGSKVVNSKLVVK
jgi:hypothetical protein